MATSTKWTATFANIAIGKVIDLDYSGGQAGVEDTSNQSISDSARTFDFSGLVDWGEVTLTCECTGNIPALGTVGSLVLVHPTIGTYTYTNAIFNGGGGFKAKLATHIVSDLKFKVSGKPSGPTS